MTYSIKELAKLAGVSVRTLHHYDDIGLLKPCRQKENGYRVYHAQDVDRLQHILFFREMNMPLDDIKRVLQDEHYDALHMLEKHLDDLKGKRLQLDALIDTVEKSIASKKGVYSMLDHEKFIGLKKKMVSENDAMYGDEVREKYGKKVFEDSNLKLMGMTEDDFKDVNACSEAISKHLVEAVALGDPTADVAQALCDLHKKWLMLYWPEYSKEAHLSLAEGYVSDPRFKAYYDGIVQGGAVFLRDALRVFCQ